MRPKERRHDREGKIERQDVEARGARLARRGGYAQGLADGDDIIAILFCSRTLLFLKGSSRWRRKRKIADWLTSTFSPSGLQAPPGHGTDRQFASSRHRSDKLDRRHKLAAARAA
jgi:hypothetical protein